MPDFCQAVLPEVEAFLEAHPQPEGDRFGGRAVVGGGGEIAGGMNAFVSADYAANQHQLHVNLMTLLRLDEELEPEPWLAEAWELSEDGTELEFRIRDDVLWHDGTPTTAHDVAFTFLRVTDPETGFPNAAFWRHYVEGEGGVEVVDDHTIRFRLHPHAGPLNPWFSVAVMPRHLLEDVPPAELRQHPYGNRCPVGNGPFVFRDHQQDASWTFRRNPAFPEGLGGPAPLEHYVYRVIPEQTTLLTELLTGGVDVYIGPSPDQVPQIEAADHLEVHDFLSRNYDFVGWNTRRPHLSDVRVRRALTLGTNRQQIVDALLRGYGTVANSGVPPFHPAYMQALEDSLAHDPERAARLLDEAGWTLPEGGDIRTNADGEPLEISLQFNVENQMRRDIAEIMQAQLREVGVAIRPEGVEFASLINRINDPQVRDFDGVVVGWVTDFRVDDHDLFHSTRADTPYGWSGIADDRLDVLLDTLQLVQDLEEAAPFWEEYQLRLVELQPYTWLYFPERLAGTNRRLHGAEPDVRGEWANIHRWWVMDTESP